MNNRPPSSLPEPNSEAIEHSAKLASLIARELAHGPISFARYMQMALYEPGLGYYMAGTNKFGSQGDFITSPEVSELFALCLAEHARAVFECTENAILEFGAGSGRLAADLLKALGDVPDLHYYILEPSAELQYRQASLIESIAGPSAKLQVTWLNRLPQEFSGYCIANEVLDAMPVERFHIVDSKVKQLGVEKCPNADQFRLTNLQAPSELQAAVESIEHETGSRFAEGYVSEINQAAPAWIGSLAQCISNGVITLIDYGYGRREYYMAERCQGTLNCYYAHHSVPDPFRYPGLQDITAHVDFTQIVESAVAADLEFIGYTSQASFLLELGITELAQQRQQSCATTSEQLQVARELKTLTLPGEMGERFQVMCLAKGVDIAPIGFLGTDLSHRL